MSDHGYRDFIASKFQSITACGFPVSALPESLFDFQRAIVAWAVGRGKAAIFADTGLGKTAMQRTKAIGLLYKQLKKDSCMSRQGIPDYLVTMRKPGENLTRVTKNESDFPVSVWQRYASPVWMDINPSKTLQFRSARETDDERHICPLQRLSSCGPRSGLACNELLDRDLEETWQRK